MVYVSTYNRIIIDIKSENKRRKNNIKKITYLYSNGFIDYKQYFNGISNYKNSIEAR